ncbi:Cinnamoyl-CoA reductase 1 [Vitis vinifera]|uniref:Cinnamoyl-CoA reductase 1 n=1 Tax=Vitis vinifera TaxID=29760 RepID=A0A438CAU1_VITVI|nr:Cinnamoyl-CoA reductase 1 [Vitis vinifera]
MSVLGSCAKVPSVKRVVVTSSMASVAFNGKPLAPDVLVDESWFSDPVFCEKSKLWYMLSKTLAEEAAWKFGKENGIDMVTINPGWVIGPLLQPTLNLSVEEVLKLLKARLVWKDPWTVKGLKACLCNYYPELEPIWFVSSLANLFCLQLTSPVSCFNYEGVALRLSIGRDTFPNKTHRWVDVRDVAMAHIQAYELPTARGRYCLVGSILHCSETMKILRKLYPALNLPEKCADDKPYEPTYMVSQEKTKSLGIDFTPLEVSMKDTVESLREKNFRLVANKLCKGNVLDYTIYVKGDGWRRKGGLRDRSFWVYSFMAGEAPAPTPLHSQATVRDPNDPKKTQHLLSLDGAQERLHLFKADLLEKGSFDSVVDGCDGVFHTSSPVALEAINPQTLAEEAAWKFSKENGIDMVTINPGWVIGAQTFPNISSWWVDVRDVANAHIQAYEIPEASGRYCLVERDLHNSEILKILRKLYPGLPLPERCADDKPYAPSSRVSQEKAKSLVIHFTPLEVSLKDTVESLKEKNFVSF